MFKEYQRAELHAHSEYSNKLKLDCIIKLKDLIAGAAKRGYSGIALTDHDCLSGHIQAQEIEEEVQKEYPDFKVVLGNEIYLVKNREKAEGKRYYHFILLALDEIGHRYIRELSTRAWSNSYFERGVLRTATLYEDIKEVVKEQGHLVAQSACLGSYLSVLIMSYVETKDETYRQYIDDFVQWGIETFGKEYFYLEMQAGTTKSQVEVNKMLCRIAQGYGLKFIITDDVHFLDKQDKMLHEVYLSSQRKNSEDNKHEEIFEACYFKDDEDLKERLSYLPDETIREACKNTLDVLSKAKPYKLQKDTIVPPRELPQFTVQGLFSAYYTSHKYLKLFAESEFEQDRYLLSELEKGFVEKKQDFAPKNIDRIETELRTLWKVSERLHQRLSAYYNLTQEVIDIMWDDNKGNSLVGISRGSASGFYICYLMGITQLNPIDHELVEWRHLHESRPELPDIDTDTERIRRPYIFQALKDHFGEDRVLNIITFRTEGSKSAVLNSARGLGFSLEEAQELADMIPVKRGIPYTIQECMEGDPSNEKEPVKGFASLMKQYDGLLDMALRIEGLVCGISSHASGLYIFEKNYVEQNSVMRTPSGQFVTCWSMHDSDKMGALKIDLLTIVNLDYIHTTLNLLLEDGVIQWQGNLRKTYEKYIGTLALDYKTPEMFEMLWNGQASNIFQLSTDVGSQACKLTHPYSLKQMALVNSLMRLSGDSGELPLYKFQRFKEDISLWYKEMEDCHLTKEEIAILEKYLLDNSGIAAEQEDVMQLVMDEKIAGFDMAQANKLRKGIAKKKKAILGDCKNLFYSKGKEQGTSLNMLDYVWNHQISLSLGYSFSRNHTVPYSCIGLQQLNLLYHYPKIYSYGAYLLVDSSSEDGNDDNKIKYGEIAKSLINVQKLGVKVELPDINIAKSGFGLKAEDNGIIFGLKSMPYINDEAIAEIRNNAPYSSLAEFVERNTSMKTVQIIYLIKGGCFDELEKKPREEILKDYFYYIASQKVSTKDKITPSLLTSAQEAGLIEDKNNLAIRCYNFNKYVADPIFVIKKENRKTWLLADSTAFSFFDQYYCPILTEEKDYFYTKDGILFNKSSYNKKYKEIVEALLESLNTPQNIEKYNKFLLQSRVNELYEKYGEGSVSDWEMSALSFYYHEHPLKGVSKEKYNIVRFSDLGENPNVEEEYQYQGRTCYKYTLSRVCGTIIDNDRVKHTVSLLTPEEEVITIKFYAGAYIQYNKDIVEIDRDGKKIIKDHSWLSRGSKLLITGFRRGDNFFPKVYDKNIYQHSVSKIDSMTTDGTLGLTMLRYGQEEKQYYRP